MKDYKENAIEFLNDQKKATVTLHQRKYINKVRKLAMAYPDEVDIIHENNDGSIVAHIPVHYIKISCSKRNISDEVRRSLSERAKLYLKRGATR